MTLTETPRLIPRARLFGNPTRQACYISPDGRWLTYVAPHNGVLNVWIAPVEDPGAARLISDDRKRGIQMYGWMPNGTHLIYVQDEGGNEDWQVHAVEIDTGMVRNLTPLPGTAVQPMGSSIDRPNTIAAGLNDRDKAWHDLYLIDVRTGERELIFENRHELSRFILDRQLRLRLASRARASEGGYTRFRIEGGDLVPNGVVEHQDEMTTRMVGFTRDGSTLYSISSAGRDKAALFAIDWQSGAERLLAEHPKADIDSVLTHPQSGVIDAVKAIYLMRDWVFVDKSIGGDIAFLEDSLPGQVGVADRTLDDRRWIVVSTGAESPADFHLYDRDKRQLTALFASRPELKGYRLSPMQGEIISSRDDLDLTAYLTLPLGEGRRPQRPLPMVLLVHGGPWARDFYGFEPEHQWLANRGVAVLSVNFRGSTGFGKGFINAGDLEWGRKMHDDLIDAVDWAVAEGIAVRDRIAIMGISYGGYATLAGLTFTPDVFCCGVDIVGPSNLETLLATIPPYWTSMLEMFARRTGDPRTEAGRALLRERSPLHFAGNIVKPLLIAQGANDPRVKQAEADQIIAAMTAKGLPVTYVLYAEEGHGFIVPENDLSFHAIAEAFLTAHLGTAAESIGDDFKGAKFEVREGAAHVPGLGAALAR